MKCLDCKSEEVVYVFRIHTEKHFLCLQCLLKHNYKRAYNSELSGLQNRAERLAGANPVSLANIIQGLG